MFDRVLNTSQDRVILMTFRKPVSISQPKFEHGMCNTKKTLEIRTYQMITVCQ